MTTYSFYRHVKIANSLLFVTAVFSQTFAKNVSVLAICELCEFVFQITDFCRLLWRETYLRVSQVVYLGGPCSHEPLVYFSAAIF